MNATELVLRLVDRLVTQEHAMCVNERVDKEVWKAKEQNWFAKQDELEKELALAEENLDEQNNTISELLRVQKALKEDIYEMTGKTETLEAQLALASEKEGAPQFDFESNMRALRDSGAIPPATIDAPAKAYTTIDGRPLDTLDKLVRATLDIVSQTPASGKAC